MKPEIQSAILSLLAADHTVSVAERDQWRAQIEGRIAPEETLCKDTDDALTNDDAAKFLGLSRVSFWRLKIVKPDEPLIRPYEPKPGVLRYSRQRLAHYRQKTTVTTAFKTKSRAGTAIKRGTAA